MRNLTVADIVFGTLPFVLLILAGFKQRPGADVDIQIEHVVSISNEASGKFRYIVCEAVVGNAGNRA